MRKDKEGGKKEGEGEGRGKLVHGWCMFVDCSFFQIISHLETNALSHEGLLRIPGSTARVNTLIQSLEDTFHTGKFSFTGTNINDVCSLLKQFIR